MGQLIGKLNERTPKILSAEGKKYDFQKRKEEGCVQSKIKLLITIFYFLKLKIRITRYLKGLEVPDGGAPVLRERHLEVGQLVEGGGAGHQG